jgi:hypothetical protein
MVQLILFFFHRSRNRTLPLIALWIALIAGPLSAQTADVTVAVDVNTVINPRSTLLLGITYDARSSMRGASGPIGYHDTSGALLPGIQPLFGDFPVVSFRYPANAVSFGFNWKASVGHPALRPAQNIVGIGPAQPMKFGFDEFMAMTAARGALPKDVQIMLTIYTKGTPGLTQLQAAAAIDDAAISAADWVEYANGADSSKNPGGGVNWAAERMKNGHPAPYGIRIWNLGNEPWGSGEFGNDTAAANKYAATVRPIIDSMLTRDPSILITIPSTGPATSPWNTTLMNHPLLKGKVYAISPHFFPEETAVGGAIPLGVAKVETALPALIDSAKAKGWGVIVGDFAHGIPTANGVPVGDPNLAMQWQGANLTADFLLMISQQRNIERANFWAYGLPQGTWHPIRLNGPGSYTLLPAGMLYKKLFPLFLDRSVSVKTVSPKGSDGNAYSVRAGGFMSADSHSLSIIAVNRDKQDSHIVSVSGVAGYSVVDATLMTGGSLTAEVIDAQAVSPAPNGTFALPPMSVLSVRYGKTAVTAVSESNILPTGSLLLQNYPNPFNPSTTIQFRVRRSGRAVLTLYSMLGQQVAELFDGQTEAGAIVQHTFDATGLGSGIYFLQLRANGESATRRIVVLK